MKKVDFLRSMYDLVKTPNPDSLKLSMQDTHHPGIFSLVIGGTEFGKLTRVFIADTKLKPFEVQLHTHRYGLQLTVIKGNVRHFLGKPRNQYRDYEEGTQFLSMSEFTYKSPLNGGDGLKYRQETKLLIEEYDFPVGASIQLNSFDFHTMSCSKGSMWIVQEQGFVADQSNVLGVPFITEGLYNAPAPFQINDKCQLVAKTLKKLILDYELVGL